MVENNLEIWAKPLSNNTWAICFLNRSNETKSIDFDWKANVIEDALVRRNLDANKVTYRIRDLWAKKELGTTDSRLRHSLSSHDVLMLKLEK